MLHVENITLNQVKKAAADGQNITVIINGEFYDLTPEETPEEITAFIEGLNFAAALIKDNRSRRFFSWQGINQARHATKKEQEKQQELNKEVRYLSDCLIHLVNNPGALENARAEHNKNGFWDL